MACESLNSGSRETWSSSCPSPLPGLFVLHRETGEDGRIAHMFTACPLPLISKTVKIGFYGPGAERWEKQELTSLPTLECVDGFI